MSSDQHRHKRSPAPSSHSAKARGAPPGRGGGGGGSGSSDMGNQHLEPVAPHGKGDKAKGGVTRDLARDRPQGLRGGGRTYGGGDGRLEDLMPLEFLVDVCGYPDSAQRALLSQYLR